MNQSQIKCKLDSLIFLTSFFLLISTFVWSAVTTTSVRIGIFWGSLQVYTGWTHTWRFTKPQITDLGWIVWSRIEWTLGDSLLRTPWFLIVLPPIATTGFAYFIARCWTSRKAICSTFCTLISFRVLRFVEDFLLFFPVLLHLLKFIETLFQVFNLSLCIFLFSNQMFLLEHLLLLIESLDGKYLLNELGYTTQRLFYNFEVRIPQ